MKYLKTYDAYSFISESRFVQKSQVSLIIKDIEKRLFPVLHLNGWDKDVALVGSAGRRQDESELSSAIDIAVLVPGIQSGSEVGIESTLELIRASCEEMGCSGSIDAAHGAVEVNWKNETGFRKSIAPVRFIPVESLEWAKFIYYSPDFSIQQTKYLGVYRGLFFRAITDIVQHRVRKFRKEWKNAKPGDVHAYDRYSIDAQRGLMKQRLNYRGKTGRLQDPVQQGDSELATTIPRKLVKFLFGEKTKPNNVLTFDDCWKVFNSPKFRYPDQRKEIIKRFIELVKLDMLPVPELLR